MGNRTSADLGDPDSHPLVRAVALGDVDTVARFLLSYDVDVNGLTSSIGVEGRTLLHVAVENNRTDMIMMLLSRGARVDALDGNGRTPLWYGVSLAGVALPTIRCLIEQGRASVDASVKGVSVLHQAIIDERFDRASILLRYSPNLNTARLADLATPCHSLVASLAVDVQLLDKILRAARWVASDRLIVTFDQRYNTRSGNVVSDSFPKGDVRCGSCHARLNPSSREYQCCLCLNESIASCFGKERWQNAFLDALTWNADTPLGSAAQSVASGSANATESVKMLLLHRSNGIMESLVA